MPLLYANHLNEIRRETGKGAHQKTPGDEQRWTSSSNRLRVRDPVFFFSWSRISICSSLMTWKIKKINRDWKKKWLWNPWRPCRYSTNRATNAGCIKFRYIYANPFFFLLCPFRSPYTVTSGAFHRMDKIK